MKRRPTKSALSRDRIIELALEHFKSSGRWPHMESGRVRATHGLTWGAVDRALRDGYRSLPGGESLRALLDGCFPRLRAMSRPSRLTQRQIVQWADAHHRRTGRWPGHISGPVYGVPGLTWGAIESALVKGTRSLPGGSSIARLIGRVPGSRKRLLMPALTIGQILEWARAHHRRTGVWPSAHSGTVLDAPRENWCAINMTLKMGFRGLRGGTTLSQLLQQYVEPGRGRRKSPAGRLRKPKLAQSEILAWADRFHARNQGWPRSWSGRVLGQKDLTWRMIDSALKQGYRGLHGGKSLVGFLHFHRRAPYVRAGKSPLNEKQILAWADAHFRRKKKWPNGGTGPVLDAPGEIWLRLRNSLGDGTRGLPGGSSLARLLARHRGVPHQKEGLRPRIRPYGRYGRGRPGGPVRPNRGPKDNVVHRYDPSTD